MGKSSRKREPRRRGGGGNFAERHLWSRVFRAGSFGRGRRIWNMGRALARRHGLSPGPPKDVSRAIHLHFQATSASLAKGSKEA